MEDKCTVLKRILWTISFLPLVITAISMRFLPDELPMHFDAAGNIDRWGTKYEFWIIAVLLVFFGPFFIGTAAASHAKAKDTHDEEERIKTEANRKALLICGIVITLLTDIILVVIMFSCTSAVDSGTGMSTAALYPFETLLLSVVLIALGNIMPKTRRNSMIGLRTSWSCYNDETWYRSNLFGGIGMIVCGVIGIIAALVFHGAASFWIVIILSVIASIVMIVYSYKVYCEVKERE